MNHKTKTLTNMEWDTCDHSITEKDILSSLKQLHNGKPPDVFNFF